MNKKENWRIKQMQLIILQNGLHGLYYRMNGIKRYLENGFMNMNICDYQIYVSNVNDFLKTHDGIEAGGQRLVEFVKNICNETKYETISFIGHSLGGLYIRNCIGILEEEDFLNI